MKRLLLILLVLVAISCMPTPVPSPPPSLPLPARSEAKSIQDAVGNLTEAFEGLTETLCGPSVESFAERLEMPQGNVLELDIQLFVKGKVARISPELVIDVGGNIDVEVILQPNSEWETGENFLGCIQAHTVEVMTGSVGWQYIGIRGEIVSK